MQICNTPYRNIPFSFDMSIRESCEMEWIGTNFKSFCHIFVELKAKSDTKHQYKFDWS